MATIYALLNTSGYEEEKSRTLPEPYILCIGCLSHGKMLFLLPCILFKCRSDYLQFRMVELGLVRKSKNLREYTVKKKKNRLKSSFCFKLEMFADQSC